MWPSELQASFYNVPCPASGRARCRKVRVGRWLKMCYASTHFDCTYDDSLARYESVPVRLHAAAAVRPKRVGPGVPCATLSGSAVTRRTLGPQPCRT